MGLQKKLSIVFIFVIILPVSLANYIAYLNYTRLISERANEYTNQISVKMMNKLEDYVEDMKGIADVTQYSEELQNYLQQPDTDSLELTLEKRTKIEFIILLLNRMKRDTNSIYIFDNAGHPFYNFRTFGYRANLQEEYAKWKEIAAKANGSPVLISTQEVPMLNEKPIYLFSVVKEIKDLYTLKTVGTVVVDANVSVIREAVRELDGVTRGSTLIMDDAGHVIYDSDSAQIAEDVSQLPAVRRMTGKSGSFTLETNGERYLYTYAVSDKLGWKALVSVPLKELQRGAVVTRNATIIITSLIIALALVISLFSSYRLTRPLRQLTGLMKKVQNGRLDVNFNVRRKDEVGVLGRNFNLMLRRIQELIDEVYAAQKRKNRMEMEVLQSQINPHFMYNTLELIRMTAIMEDADEAAKMAFMLGKMLRYSINREDEGATVQSELGHLDNYMTLQNYRFNGKFALHVDVSERARSRPIVKLVLQPIVENAIFHGLEEREEHGEIRIDSVEEPGRLCLIVSDNGVGMDAETLSRLRRSLDHDGLDDRSRFGIGLRNVHIRLKLRYGEKYGLRIDSAPGEGTRIVLALPNEE